jgi:hypothetical protein
MLMGVTVDAVDKPFEAPLEVVKAVAPVAATMPPATTGGHYLVGPESYGVFRMVADLQRADVPVARTAASVAADGRTFAPGTFRIPVTPASTKIVTSAASLGIPVHRTAAALAGDAFELKPRTKVGLFRGANNMPGGWMMWLLEQYGINHAVMKAQDFQGDLNAQYDVILLPSGITRDRIVSGLDQKRNDPVEFGWAAGVGEPGWRKLAEFVRNGGTLLAIGSAVETARALLDLPIESALPSRLAPGARGQGTGGADAADRVLRDAFSSPARLMQVLRDRVAEPDNLFYCPGSLLMNEFDPSNPVAWGMPERWPVFFEGDDAFRLRPAFGVETAVAARYPREDILASGWLLGEEYLRDQANVVSFRIGRGFVVTYGTQIDFRTQPRATFRLLFNAIFHGPSRAVRLAPPPAP